VQGIAETQSTLELVQHLDQATSIGPEETAARQPGKSPARSQADLEPAALASSPGPGARAMNYAWGGEDGGRSKVGGNQKNSFTGRWVLLPGVAARSVKTALLKKRNLGVRGFGDNIPAHPVIFGGNIPAVF